MGHFVVIGEAADRACKLPPRNRAVAFNLAPGTKLVDAIAWISPILCKRFVVVDTVVAEATGLTMVAPERMRPNEAYRLFLGALDAIGLRVKEYGRSLRVVRKGTSRPRIVEPEPFVTVLVRWRDLPPEAQARLQEWLLERSPAEVCDCNVLVRDSVVVTDLRPNIERILGRRL